MRILIDEPTCQTYGICVMTAPDLFEIDEVADHVRVLRQPGADPAHRDAADAATRSCPVQAISLTETETETETETAAEADGHGDGR